MRNFFEECLRNYEQNRRSQGLAINDVALAVSYFIGVSYNVYNGGNSVSSAAGDALRAQIYQALIEDDEFGRLAAGEKQRIYETMAIMGEFVAISASVADTNDNEELRAMARDLARDNLERLLRTPISSMRITETGIIL